MNATALLMRFCKKLISVNRKTFSTNFSLKRTINVLLNFVFRISKFFNFFLQTENKKYNYLLFNNWFYLEIHRLIENLDTLTSRKLTNPWTKLAKLLEILKFKHPKRKLKLNCSNLQTDWWNISVAANVNRWRGFDISLKA